MTWSKMTKIGHTNITNPPKIWELNVCKIYSMITNKDVSEIIFANVTEIIG